MEEIVVYMPAGINLDIERRNDSHYKPSGSGNPPCNIIGY